MKSIFKVLIIVLLILGFKTIQAQQIDNTEEKVLKRNEGTIENQFEYVISKSYTYRGEYKVYKNIEQNWLTELKINVLDTINALHKNLDDTKAIVKSQTSEIEELKKNLNATASRLSNTKEKKDSMSLFGYQMSKTSYSILLWSVIAVLFAFMLLFIFKFKNSNTVTKEAKRKLEDIETEFEDHRRIALEREQKVRRQLQDEINKNKKTS